MPDMPGPSMEGSVRAGGPPDRYAAKRAAYEPDAHSTADYILDMSKQLTRLATEARLDLLAYLLEMVRIEAELVRKRTAPPLA